MLPLIGGRSHDAPLTPLGEQQAQILGRFLRTYTTLRFDAIYSSPIERSMQTANIVCQVSRHMHSTGAFDTEESHCCLLHSGLAEGLLCPNCTHLSSALPAPLRLYLRTHGPLLTRLGSTGLTLVRGQQPHAPSLPLLCAILWLSRSWAWH